MFYIPSGSPGLKSLYHLMPERLENRCSVTNRKILTKQVSVFISLFEVLASLYAWVQAFYGSYGVLRAIGCHFLFWIFARIWFRPINLRFVSLLLLPVIFTDFKQALETSLFYSGKPVWSLWRRRKPPGLILCVFSYYYITLYYFCFGLGPFCSLGTGDFISSVLAYIVDFRSQFAKLLHKIPSGPTLIVLYSELFRPSIFAFSQG